MEDNNTSEVVSEETSEENSEVTSEYSSEDSSEETSEDNVIYTETTLPEETINQIAEMHTAVITGLALFVTLFFFWFLDFVYKKFSRLF